MSRNIGEDLVLPLQRHFCYGLELEILQNRALFEGDPTLEVVLVRVADECLCNDVEIIPVSFRGHLSHELERLGSFQGVNQLTGDHIIKSGFFV